jgi:uncharacterized membrane protein
MSLHDVALVVHVLGWVFWLGTDVGVFLAARYAERADLSAETRLTVLELGMLLDRAPRLAVPIVWFTGVLLSRSLGYDLLPVAFAAAFALLWLLVTLGMIFLAPTSSLRPAAMAGQTLCYLSVIIGMGGGAGWLLSTGGIPFWLALKWFGFVLVSIAALLLEKLFAPVAVAFQELAVQGPSTPLDAAIATSLRPVYPVVLLIYLGTLVAGISGLVNPLAP